MGRAQARTIMGRKCGACVGCWRGTLHLARGWPLGGRKTLGDPIPPDRSVRAVSRYHPLVITHPLIEAKSLVESGTWRNVGIPDQTTDPSPPIGFGLRW